ncbi:MAG: helix-turn-helix transcriptional regulator [Coriobacteriales bacterium]|jgi:DNA-binding Xre family transcriptional regulator|nr:helix-turn-helix transcriptional regulator [Coriobacteriales bacterium]
MGRVVYEKLWVLMKIKGLTTYRIQQDAIISQGTLQNIRDGKDITTKSIAALCEALDCQPGDILEYVGDSTRI